MAAKRPRDESEPIRPKGKPSRSWTFTIFDYDDNTIKQLRVLATMVNRMVVNEEECPTTKRKHLQGAITFPDNNRKDAVQKLLGDDKCHVEAAFAAEAAARYCAKVDGVNVICVDNRRQGKRSDLESMREAVAARMPAHEFAATAATSLQAVLSYSRVFETIHLKKTMRLENKVFWRWGATGLNKSRYVWDTYGIDNVYTKSGNDQYWCGYKGEQAILFDDFRPGWMRWDELLRVLDIYPYMVKPKYGAFYLQPAHFYLTAPMPPEVMFKDYPEDINQLLRRITEVQHVTE